MTAPIRTGSSVRIAQQTLQRLVKRDLAVEIGPPVRVERLSECTPRLSVPEAVCHSVRHVMRYGAARQFASSVKDDRVPQLPWRTFPLPLRCNVSPQSGDERLDKAHAATHAPASLTLGALQQWIRAGHRNARRRSRRIRAAPVGIRAYIDAKRLGGPHRLQCFGRLLHQGGAIFVQ